MSDRDHTVSDLELMQYFDGELDLDEVEFDDEARGKLAALTLTAEILRDQADDDERGDGIAELVMAAVDADELGATPDEAEPASRKREKQPLDVPSADAANDNARTIYFVAGAAAAVAAGFFVWGQGAAEQELAAQADMAESKSGPTSLVADEEPSAPPVAARPSDAASADEDEALGVEIAAVDFGAQSGSVFYVSGGKAGATAVVWVTDVGDE